MGISGYSVALWTHYFTSHLEQADLVLQKVGEGFVREFIELLVGEGMSSSRVADFLILGEELAIIFITAKLALTTMSDMSICKELN